MIADSVLFAAVWFGDDWRDVLVDSSPADAVGEILGGIEKFVSTFLKKSRNSTLHNCCILIVRPTPPICNDHILLFLVLFLIADTGNQVVLLQFSKAERYPLRKIQHCIASSCFC